MDSINHINFQTFKDFYFCFQNFQTRLSRHSSNLVLTQFALLLKNTVKLQIILEFQYIVVIHLYSESRIETCILFANSVTFKN